MLLLFVYKCFIASYHCRICQVLVHEYIYSGVFPSTITLFDVIWFTRKKPHESKPLLFPLKIRWGNASVIMPSPLLSSSCHRRFCRCPIRHSSCRRIRQGSCATVLGGILDDLRWVALSSYCVRKLCHVKQV